MASNTENPTRKENAPERKRSLPSPLGRRTWRTLQQRSDFLRVRASGVRRVTPGFVLQAARCEKVSDKSPNRLIHVGFTASKKVGNAVERNRAKRRLRAIADSVLSDCAESGFDYVLIGRKETLQRTFATMEKELRQSLERIHKFTSRGTKDAVRRES